ncbi:hypothetical protein CLOP_g6810 [Closterium sp. NIES-67]|nr:hypothetical protein CLOP_g6810 [Closterium sp. NIES-67]
MVGGIGSSARRRTVATRYPWTTPQCFICLLAVAAALSNVLLFHLYVSRLLLGGSVPFYSSAGWKLGYKGHEWDEEPLRVFVVPHSHNDPGWLLTVEQYYNKSSQHILHTILRSLSQSPSRRFIWEEMSYLSRWWMDATEEEREGMRALANTHYYAIIEQLTEGNTWLYDNLGVAPTNSWAIDPFGHSATMPYLLRRSGFSNMLIQRTHYEVKKALAKQKQLEFFWRQAWDRSGGRTFEARDRSGERTFEATQEWRQARRAREKWGGRMRSGLFSQGQGAEVYGGEKQQEEAGGEGSTDIVCHMMPFYSYDIPHTCGPTPGVCCQFDFLRKRGTNNWCPWGQDAVPITRDNIAQRAQLLVDQWRKKSLLFRTNVLLVPLGDDFRYSSMLEAHAQFHNYELLFRFINSRKSLKVNASFGTLEDYFTAMRTASSRQRATRRAKQLGLLPKKLYPLRLFSNSLDSNRPIPDSLLSNARPLLPSLSGDFFTYADRDQDYWSGYFTSRPFWKAVDRALEANLRAADILYALCWSDWESSQPREDSATFQGTMVGGSSIELGRLPFPLNFAARLVLARRNLALFQHHDGITGTAKEHVVKDYSVRMHEALTDLNDFMCAAVAALLLGASNPSAPTSTALNSTVLPQQRSPFRAERRRRAHDGPWERLVVGSGVGGRVGGREGQRDTRRVVVYNPLEEERREIISVLVKSPSIAIVGQGGKCFPGQLLPEWSKANMTVTPSSGRHRLFWEASVPPLGLSTYFIVSRAAVLACPAPALSSISVFNPSPGFVCPVPYACEMVGGGGEGSGGGEENEAGPAAAAGAVDGASDAAGGAAGAGGAGSAAGAGGAADVSKDKFSISNGNCEVELGRMDGLIKGITLPAMPAPLPVREQFALYASSGGAYLFRPHGAAVPIVKEQQRGGRVKKGSNGEKEGSGYRRDTGEKGGDTGEKGGDTGEKGGDTGENGGSGSGKDKVENVGSGHGRVKGEDGGSTSLVCRGPLLEEVHTRFRFTHPTNWTAEMQAGEEGSEISGGWLVDWESASAAARKLLVTDSEAHNSEDEIILEGGGASVSESLNGGESERASEEANERGRGVSEGASGGASEEVSEEELDVLHPRHFEGKEAPGGLVWLTGEQQRVFGKWLEQTQPEKEETFESTQKTQPEKQEGTEGAETAAQEKEGVFSGGSDARDGDVAASDVAVPGVAAPGVAAPGVAAPGVAAPGVAAPGVAALGVAASVVASLGDSDARDGSVAALDLASPGVASPDVASPGVAAPVVAGPVATTPVAAAPTDKFRRFPAAIVAAAEAAVAGFAAAVQNAKREEEERREGWWKWVKEEWRKRTQGEERPSWMDDDFTYSLLSRADAASEEGFDEMFGGDGQGQEEGEREREEGTKWTESVARETREWIEARERQRRGGGALSTAAAGAPDGSTGTAGLAGEGEGSSDQESSSRRREETGEGGDYQPESSVQQQLQPQQQQEQQQQQQQQQEGNGPPEPVVRTVALYKVRSAQALLVEVQHRVDLTDSVWLGNKELVVRYQTGIRSGNVFFTDLNGFQMVKRETLSRIPIQGNFYPMPALAFLQDPSGLRFSVHTRQAVGAASLKSGWLEMVLDRRLNQDDQRGLAQGVTDNRPLHSLFHLLLEANTSSRPAPSRSSSAPLNPSLLSHRISSHLNYPPILFVGQPENSSGLSELVVQGGSGRETRAGSQGGKGGEGDWGAGRWEKQQGRNSGPGTGLAEVSAGGPAVGSEEGGAKLGGWKWGYAPLSGPLPCDMHIVSLKVHRPMPNASASAEPPIALLLHRHGVDHSFAPPRQLVHSCRPTRASGAVSLELLFSDRSVEGVEEFPLNLVRKNASSLQGHESGARLGIGESDTDSGERTSKSEHIVESMEIKAFKFWWRSKHLG